STGGPVSGQPSRGRKAVSAFVAVQGGSLALTGHVERATTGTQGRDTGRDQTDQSTTGHGQRLVVVLRGRLLVALLGLVRLLGLLGLLRLLGNLGLFRLLGLGLVDLGPGRGSIGAHTDRAVLGGDQGLGRLVGLALEQAAGTSSGATGQAEARLTGLGALGDRDADRVDSSGSHINSSPVRAVALLVRLIHATPASAPSRPAKPTVSPAPTVSADAPVSSSTSSKSSEEYISISMSGSLVSTRNLPTI